MSTLTAPAITYRLPYDATTRDHNCLVTIDGEPEQSIGYAPTFHEAEKKCRQYIDDLLAGPLFRTAEELDGGSDPGEIAAEYAAALDPYAPLGECRICGAAAWRDAGPNGLLCPSHADVLDEMLADCPSLAAVAAALTTCERYSTPPSLALWGYPNPLCPKCSARHDPILDCPGRRETSDLFSDRLCNQASDLVTRLIAEKSNLLHDLVPRPLHDDDAALDYDQRLVRLTRIIDRAVTRLSRRFIAGMRLDSTIDVSRVSGVPFVVPAPESVPVWLTVAPATRCANCDQPHHIQRCPEVWRALMG